MNSTVPQQLPIGVQLTGKHTGIHVQISGWDPLTGKYEARRQSDMKVVYIGENWTSTYTIKVVKK